MLRSGQPRVCLRLLISTTAGYHVKMEGRGRPQLVRPTIMFETQERRALDLQNWTCFVWDSGDAQANWEPRIAAAVSALRELAVLSVAASLRSCALIRVSGGVLPVAVRQGLGENLVAVPVATADLSSQLYAPVLPGSANADSAAFWVVLGTPHSVTRVQKAYDHGDNETIGSLLGIPRCCLEFHRGVLFEGSHLDTAWGTAERSFHEASLDGRELTVKGWRETNILWRWAGVCAVPHLPCSFDCAESAAFGRQILDLGRLSDLRREVDAIEEILAWPAEWSTVHGIEEIRTPIGTMTTPADRTDEKRVVRRLGIEPRPQRGLMGVSVLSRMGERSIPAREDGRSSGGSRYAAQNGFFSVEGMQMTHRPIVEYVRSLLDKREGSTVLDLGCGNGALLCAICEHCAGLKAVGVEIDAECAQSAQRYLGEVGGAIIPGDMFENPTIWEGPVRYDVVLVMICRLLEVSDERARRLVGHIFDGAMHLVVYAYEDELIRHRGTLSELASRRGLRLSNWDGRSSVCEATIAEDRLVGADVGKKR
jgi:hypothetical protein